MIARCYHGFMGQVLIRNLDDAVINAYRTAAIANQRSLEAELRDGLGRGQPREDRAALLAISQRLRAKSRNPPDAPEGWELIRADRDGDRET